MLAHSILESDGIVVVKPDAPISENDVAGLRSMVDEYLSSHDRIHGVMVEADRFPGWQDLKGFMAHMKFVRRYHGKVDHLALVTDSKLARAAAFVAENVAHVHAKKFEHEQEQEALRWLRSN